MTLKIEQVEVVTLKLDPNNVRKHDSANLKAIEFSLTTFGQRKPIVISQDNVVVAGNGTLTAAKSLGWKEVAVVRIPSEWDSSKIKAFAIADNRTAELASWDAELLAQQTLELEEEDFDITALSFKAQIVELPSNLLDDEEEARLDQRATISCPNCACEFRKTATGFEIV